MLVRVFAALVLLLVVAAGARDVSADATSVCLGHEIGAVGRRVGGMGNCHALALAGGKPVSDACLERARARCCREVPAAGCVSAAQQGANADAVESFVTDLLSALPPGATAAARRCAAIKVRAAAGAAAAALACHAKAARSGRTVDAPCLDAAQAKLRKKWLHVELRGGCATNGDVDVVATRIAALVDAIVGIGTPTPTFGVYDVTFQPTQSGYPQPTVGNVAPSSEGSINVVITFTIFDSLTLFGPVQPDGSVVLDGYFIQGGDIVHRANGDAQLSASVAEQRMTGTVDVPTLARTYRFTMTRPGTGTPPVFTGAYAFTFDGSPNGCACSSTASVTIDVPATGLASTTGGEDRDAMGVLLGTFAAGQCQVAPSGRALCWIPYDAVDPNSFAGHCESLLGGPCPVQLLGNLPTGPTTGAGSFLLGLAPSIFTQGDWTAAK
jgi:hypothetical protein